MSSISSAFWDVVDFLQTYNGAVTAVATIIIAAFTIILGIFTVSVARSTRKAADASTKAVQTAQAEFVAGHRPRLRIRNVVVKSPRFVTGKVVLGQFYIANVGSSRADILDGHCAVYWTNDGLPMERPYEGGVDNLSAAQRTLLSGESTPVLFQSEKPLGAEGRTFGMKAVGGFDLYVMGWVTYADRNNDVRRTAFCRQYFKIKGPDGEFAGGEGRFYPVINPDYEHEE